MKSIIGAACAIVALTAAMSDAAWANPQHERMRRCNAEAREQALKGDARKAFMSTCLRGKHAAPAAAATEGAEGEGKKEAEPAAAAPAEAEVALTDARSRRKACNQQATERSLKGAERKAFVAECVKA